MNTVGKKMRRGVCRDESGAVAIITAICLLVLLGFVALVIDIGHIKAVRNELQNAADASALAGTRALFDVPVQPGEQLIPVVGPPNCTLGVTRAQNTINQGDTQNLAILAADIQTGAWDWQANTFTPTNDCALVSSMGAPGINAVRVTARKDSLANNPLNNWFARIWGIDTANVMATATAAVGFVSGLSANSGGFPIAMNKDYRDAHVNEPPPANPGITFSPDGTDTAGWCGPSDIGVNANLLKSWLTGSDPTGLPTEINLGDNIDLQNGNVDSAIQKLAQVLPSHTQNYKFTLNGINYSYDGWLVLLPVVTVDKFNQSATVVDFQPIIITNAQAQGNPKTISFVFYHGPLVVDGGISGGATSGLFADRPKLVGRINSLF